MKSIIILAFLLFSENLVAQYAVVQPECFKLPSIPGSTCPAEYIGNMYFNTQFKVAAFCRPNNSIFAVSPWEGTSDIYYMGKVGIFNNSPAYDLHVSSSSRINTALVNGNVGINTLTPTEKVELVNRDIYIFSTADNYSWRFSNNTANHRFGFSDNVSFAMNIFYGGNLTVNNLIPRTDKLYVEGDVNYNGSLSVEGKGTLSNTNANQLVMVTTTVTTPNQFIVTNNTCATNLGYSFANGTFASPPAVVLFGQKIAGGTADEGLVFSIEGVTLNSGTIRVCNNTGTNVGLSNYSYSIIAIGQ